MTTHDAALDFARINHRAILATFRPDGSIQMSPVLAGVDAEGRVIVSSAEDRLKVRNLERDPRAAVCVLTEGFFGEWHSIEGLAEILHLPDALDPLVDYYRRVSGEHPDWDEYRRAMATERRVLIRITPQRSGPAAS